VGRVIYWRTHYGKDIAELDTGRQEEKAGLDGKWWCFFKQRAPRSNGSEP
jgi:hypothetical protein